MATELTAKGLATRTRIVDSAAELIRNRGAAETTLDDVRSATSTSKSQLFHYFPEGRHDLLTAVAQHEAAQVLATQQPWLDNLGTDDQWIGWRAAVIDHYTEMGSRCPLGALTSQLGKASPQARGVVVRLYDEWESKIASGVRKRQASGLLEAEVDTQALARGILVAIQGGVVMLQATERTTYLHEGLRSSLGPLNIVG